LLQFCSSFVNITTVTSYTEIIVFVQWGLFIAAYSEFFCFVFGRIFAGRVKRSPYRHKRNGLFSVLFATFAHTRTFCCSMLKYYKWSQTEREFSVCFQQPTNSNYYFCRIIASRMSYLPRCALRFYAGKQALPVSRGAASTAQLFAD